MRSSVEIIFDGCAVEIGNLNANEQRARYIEQVDKDGNVIQVFSSIAAAERELGIYHISECVNGIRKTAGGYYWREKGD